MHARLQPFFFWTASHLRRMFPGTSEASSWRFPDYFPLQIIKMAARSPRLSVARGTLKCDAGDFDPSCPSSPVSKVACRPTVCGFATVPLFCSSSFLSFPENSVHFSTANPVASSGGAVALFCAPRIHCDTMVQFFCTCCRGLFPRAFWVLRVIRLRAIRTPRAVPFPRQKSSTHFSRSYRHVVDFLGASRWGGWAQRRRSSFLTPPR